MQSKEVGYRTPLVLFTIAVMAAWIADAWDEKPITPTTVTRVEQQVRPHLKALLSLEGADPGLHSRG